MLEIKRDRVSEYYMSDNRALGNCFTVNDGTNTYHYEFEINGENALVKYDSILHIKEAIQEFRKYNKQVIRFKTENGSFYQAFDSVFTFKLPISILQPSKCFIDRNKMDAVEKHLSSEELYVPVCIIDEEYVLLDGHARVRYLLENDHKMVNVYMEEPDEFVKEYVYIAKENNLSKVKSLEILSHEDYLEYELQAFGEETE